MAMITSFKPPAMPKSMVVKAQIPSMQVPVMIWYLGALVMIASLQTTPATTPFMAVSGMT